MPKRKPEQTVNLYSIFPSIDGEVNLYGQGRLTTFIRFAGCNIKCSYCFGVIGGRRIPRIITSNGTNKKLSEVVEGDTLLTFDENGDLVETKVVETITRKVDRWLRIKVNGTLYFVTEEHPFFTNRGLVKASDLTIGDMIMHASPEQKMSFYATNYNSMKDPNVARKSGENTNYKEVGRKISRTIQKKKEKGTYKSAWEDLSENKKNEIKEKIGAANAGERNGNWGGGLDKNYNRLKNLVRRGEITKCQKCGKFTKIYKIGHGGGWGLDVHHKDGNNKNDDPNNLAVWCESCHYSDHEVGYNFWAEERGDGKQLVAMNGFEVEDIKLFDRKSFSPSIRPKPLKVYNLDCAPYSSYLIDYMWVHNCDTGYALPGKSGTPTTISAIMKKVDEIGIPKVTITGGEPLLQYDGFQQLTKQLYRGNYITTVETNGTFPCGGYGVSGWIVDYKLPSSGCQDQMLNEAFIKLTANDFVKFVIKDKQDYDMALDVRKWLKKEFAVSCQFAFSPVHDKFNPNTLIKWLIKDGVTDVSVNFQLHKIIKLKEAK
jgi:7-carboxy-7-deazaguanine synthase